LKIFKTKSNDGWSDADLEMDDLPELVENISPQVKSFIENYEKEDERKEAYVPNNKG
jgi:hypothetical protein